MASNNRGRKPQRKTVTRKSSSKKAAYTKKKSQIEGFMLIKQLLVASFAVFLFVCNFNLVGKVGNAISGALFGLFGVLNYIVAPFIAVLIIYSMRRGAGRGAFIKVVPLVILFFLGSMISDIISGISKSLSRYDVKAIFNQAMLDRKGGGLFAGSLTYVCVKYIDIVGTWILIIVLLLICVIVFTEGSVIVSLKEKSKTVMEASAENKAIKREIYDEKRERYEIRREENRIRHENQKRINEEKRQNKAILEAERKEAQKLAKADEEVLRKNRKVKGVTFNTDLGNVVTENRVINTPETDNTNDDIHEINLNGFNPGRLEYTKGSDIEEEPLIEEIIFEEIPYEIEEEVPVNDTAPHELQKVTSPSIARKNEAKTEANEAIFEIESQISNNSSVEEAVYEFPPRSLLTKGSKKGGDSAATIKQTAEKLERTLAIFGVEASVTEVSQGPTVTRFELQPKLGVKVSRIKNLSDDIKLNLAASEIRIEAPIPGKAAIGIEVPNKEATPVLFRDLIDTPEYNDFPSDLAFAVGKDISGKPIVYGIDSFPHLLIAGQTGAGKSVCINTMIMSILYKASPDDVKIIMIDPKVVELSVYNDIPHLLLPVVTNVKKAAATLQYAVNDMQERYKKFAELGVRDINGYNRAVKERGEDSFHKKLPRIVIIVDEMAELMLQERKSVEEAICSLAQLARAAGIHLVIATQRPSVDVITGLIKANMPSRIAFSVASNVDSRTILDMGGAEELLGKGDMLFFPKGLKKPVRLQGAFLSDKEVSDVVEFLKNHGKPSYDMKVQEQIETNALKSESSSSSMGGSSDDGGDGTDELFADAGYLIIDSQKASIGMLQRKFRIGFNRAARIMDQLSDAGVVGPEVGTKPRDILMSRESFENYLEQN